MFIQIKSYDYKTARLSYILIAEQQQEAGDRMTNPYFDFPHIYMFF